MSWSEGAFEALAHLIGTRTGLTFTPERRAGVELAIRRAMARARVSDPARYLDRIKHDDALLDDLIGALTIGETYFFREPAQFRFIRDVILPELQRTRGAEHTIRVWSAGCASGEEAYSLAMLFDEEGLSGRIHLLATDISRAALAKARPAIYSAWSLRGEGAAAARPYLSRVGDRNVVDPSIRTRVSFEYLNLALDLYPSYASGTWGMDLILCRNVLIYFDRATVRNVAGRLYASLAEGGWLITASSDPPLAEWAPFGTVVTDQGVFYRRRAQPLGPLPARDDRDSDPRPARLSEFLRPRAEGPGWGAMIPTSGGTTAQPDPLSHGGRGGIGPPQVARPSGQGDGKATEEILKAAREDLSRGDYARAVERTRDLVDDAGASALHVRALANLDLALAERACAEAATRHPLAGALHYLRALLLLGLGREGEAARAARRVIYLDRSLALAHFLLGSILQRHGDWKGAWRAYRNAQDLCAARPEDEIVPLSDGEPAGRLAEAARVQMQRLQAVAKECR
ncbi:MAG: CheR family methyltransferase [Planctomycetaceae bacterium]